MLRYILSFVICLLGMSAFSCEGEEKRLYIYGWSGSIDQSILKDFEKETGIKVSYDVYDNNDILEAKLLTGKAKFDLVMPSVTPNFLRQIEMKVFQPIQWEKIPNYKNLDGRILKLIGQFDAENRYGVPFTLGTTGFGYDKKKLDALFPEGVPESLGLLFEEENIQKMSKCGVILLDFPQDILEASQAFLGYEPQCHDRKKLESGLEALRKVRSHVREFTGNSDRVVRELASGEACFVHLWSNDALLAQQEALEQGRDIRYVIPREWPGLWVDMLAIPKHAAHPQNAHLFINFLLRPDIAARIVKTTLMAVPNTKIREHLPKALQDNSMIFIPDYALENLRIQENLSFKDERMLIRKWTHFKLGW